MSVEINELVYADAEERLLAIMVDYACILLLWVVIYFFAIMFFENQQFKIWHSFSIEWLYFSSQHSSYRRATLGMRCMNLRIVNMNAQQITLRTASIRYVMSVVSIMILWLGHLMMFGSDLNQTMYDRIAGTLVVKNPTL